MADKDVNIGSVRLQWNGDTVTRALEEGLWTGLVRAGLVLQRSMQKTVGIPGHPRSRRSLPGEPPRVETNLLRKSISTVPSKGERVVRVGTNVPHGRYMEFGTKNVAPRPWVYRSIQAARDAMNAALQSGVRERLHGLVQKGGGR